MVQLRTKQRIVNLRDLRLSGRSEPFWQNEVSARSNFVLNFIYVKYVAEPSLYSKRKRISVLFSSVFISIPDDTFLVVGSETSKMGSPIIISFQMQIPGLFLKACHDKKVHLLLWDLRRRNMLTLLLVRLIALRLSKSRSARMKNNWETRDATNVIYQRTDRK